jgi:hypothetical protein
MTPYLRKAHQNKVTCTSMFVTALSTTVKVSKQPRCPTNDEWIKKMGLLTEAKTKNT